VHRHERQASRRAQHSTAKRLHLPALTGVSGFRSTAGFYASTFLRYFRSSMPLLSCAKIFALTCCAWLNRGTMLTSLFWFDYAVLDSASLIGLVSVLPLLIIYPGP
jgi:hypothetical protein